MEPVNNIVDLAQERRRRGPRFDGGLMDILEVSRDLVCLCRGGVITAINGAGAKLLGGKVTEDVVGRRLVEFLIPEYAQVLEIFMAGMASEDKPVPTRLLGMDRKVRDVELQVFRAREIAKDATVVVGRDTSHEGQLAGKVYESDARYHLLVDNAMNLVCHVRDGQICYINKAGITMLGVTDASDIIGQGLARIFHGDYADLAETDALLSIVEENCTLPMQLSRADGTRVDATVMITRLDSPCGLELMIEARDITAHNRAVGDLRRSNETLELRVVERTRELNEQRAVADEARMVADASRRFTESLLEALPSPVWFKDARGVVQSCNREFRQLFKDGDSVTYGPGPLPGFPVEDMNSDHALLNGSLRHTSFEATISTQNGEREALVMKSAYLDEDGHPVGIIGVLTDITDRKVMEGELRRLATVDPLTGAHNRRHFLGVATSELERSQRYGHPMTVIMMDIDHFKRINDTHGHAVGDDALKATVNACLHELRDTDTLGRLGGEEFAILLPETPIHGGIEVAERLRLAMAALRTPLPNGDMLAFTCSLGVAVHEPGDADFASILARADGALYRAKSGGRNRVEVGF